MYPLPALARLHHIPRFGPDMIGTGTRPTTGLVNRFTGSGRRMLRGLACDVTVEVENRSTNRPNDASPI
jgi:hypothetical protein